MAWLATLHALHSSSAAHDIDLVLVHGATRVVPSQAEQPQLGGDHIVALVPWRWEDLCLGLGSSPTLPIPVPHSLPCILIPKATEITDGVPRCWTLRVSK